MKIMRTDQCSSQFVVIVWSCRRSMEVRPAVAADRPAVSNLVKGLSLNESLLQDLDCFYEACRDPVSQLILHTTGASLISYVCELTEVWFINCSVGSRPQQGL